MSVPWPQRVVGSGPSVTHVPEPHLGRVAIVRVVLKVGVLASGTGSLFEAICDDADNYEVVVLVTDRPDIRALDIAEERGIPSVVLPFKSFGSRDEFSEQVAKSLLEYGSELIAHAGFMRILTQPYLDLLAPRVILNSHPSLLPRHPGAHGVRDALEAGDTVTGTTIHHVTLALDAGPVVVQEQVPIYPTDTEDSLHERIKVVERRLYPEVIRSFAS